MSEQEQAAVLADVTQAAVLADVTRAMTAEALARGIYDQRKQETDEAMTRARVLASLRQVAAAAGVTHEEVRRRTTREPAAA